MSQLPTVIVNQASIDAVKNYHRAAQNCAAQAVAYAILAGLELNKIKKEVGHGNFLSTVAQHFPELPERTARRYMDLSDGIKDKALKSATVADLKLLDSKPSELDDKGGEKLQKLVAKAAGGQTLTQLYMDYGIVKKPHVLTGGNTGNYHTGPRTQPSLDEQLKVTVKTAIEDMGFACSRLESGDWTLLSDPQLNAVLATIDAANRAMKKWLGLTQAQRREQREEVLKPLKAIARQA